MANWRERYAPLIASILAEHAGKLERELRKILREAFPSGPRQYHPYKIWLSEIAFQLGKKKRYEPLKGKQPVVPCAGQGELFDTEPPK